MQNRSIIFFGSILLLSSLIITSGCKKEVSKDKAAIRKELSTPIVKGKNIRKNGYVSIKIDDIEYSKNKIKEFIDDYNAQIIEENTSVNADSSLVLEFKLKVKSENFTILIDKITNLGKIIRIHIEAEDMTDELVQQTDKIDLLKSRLNNAKKSNDPKLIDKLQERLNKAKNKKAGTKKIILYSYVYVTVYETTKLSHAVSLGFNYGKEGFVWMIKILFIISIAVIPLIILILIIRIIFALIKWRWKQLILFIENIGKRKIKDKTEEVDEKEDND